MSAKFLHTIADENPDLQRQIGCMTGIFQMFDRQHLLAGKRLNAHRNLKTHHPKGGHALSSSRNGCSPHIVLERNSCKSANENQRISVESSRTSFSSSSCSSFSSVDCNKSSQEEHPSTGRSFYTERSSSAAAAAAAAAAPAKCSTKSKNYDADCRRSLDFRNGVKDSMYKDAQALSVRTPLKGDTKSHPLEHRDSPRPVQLPKSMDSTHTRRVAHADLGESLRILVKLKQAAPRDFSEMNEPPRRSYEAKDASPLMYPVSKDAPRFSYDGREMRPSLEYSRESSKMTSKLRELPRLSLDGRESSLRGSSKEFDPCHQQELGSSKRPPGVVAKLMGLEAMPSLSQDQQTAVVLEDKSFSSKMITSCQDRKDPPVAPQHKRTDSASINHRLPIEPAPWRHQNKIHLPQNPAFGFREPQVRRQSESVYSEIEKRLKDLEFQQSNKDLRALKYILDAMHSKGLLETAGKVDDQQHSNTPFQNLGSADAQHTTTSHTALLDGSKTPRSFDSPIVIMKPARSLNRLGMPPSSVIPLESLPDLRRLRTASDPIDRKKASTLDVKLQEDQTPNCQQLLSADSKCRKEENETQRYGTKMTQVSPRLQVAAREDNGSSVKSSNSVSPRLQHRKVVKEKRSSSPRPSSQSSNVPPKQPAYRSSSSESVVSPRVRLRRKPAQAGQNDDQLSESSSLNHQSDETSSRSDGNVISISQVDAEVTSSNRSSADLCLSRQSYQIPSARAAKNASLPSNQKKKSHVTKDDVSAKNRTTAADASFFQDESSPAKVSSDSSSKDMKIKDSVDCGNQTGKRNAPSSNLYSGINQKLADIEDLVQKLSQLSSNDNEAPPTDHIAWLCDTQSPDDRYVSEILLASGLLMMDLPSRSTSLPMKMIQLHPCGHPINPDLFLVLEQTQCAVRIPRPEPVEEGSGEQPKSNPEKLHRKLVFDVVNELLIQKLQLAMPDLLLRVGKARFPGGQRLLKELCADIERLKAESSAASNPGGGEDSSSMTCERMLLRQPEIWSSPGAELQTLVLDLERSIFRDMIDEVVAGEGGAFGFQAKAGRRTTAC